MTRAELETRRLQAIPELSNGTPAGKLAKKLHVSRMTISRWKAMLLNGKGLKSTKAPGRPPRINDTDRAAIRQLYLRHQKHWTQSLFANAMADELGIEYSPDHVGRIMHQLGLTTIKQRKPHE